MVVDLVGKVYKLRRPILSRAPKGFKDIVIEPKGTVFKILRVLEVYDMESESHEIKDIEIFCFKSKQTHIIPFDFDSIELFSTDLSQVLYE